MEGDFNLIIAIMRKPFRFILFKQKIQISILSWRILKKDQTYFKNLEVFKSQDF